jgi:hypothetical protein
MYKCPSFKSFSQEILLAFLPSFKAEQTNKKKTTFQMEVRINELLHQQEKEKRKKGNQKGQ